MILQDVWSVSMLLIYAAMPDFTVLNAIKLLWSVRPQPPTGTTQAKLRSLGLWCPCRVFGSRREFYIVSRRGRRSVRRSTGRCCTRCGVIISSTTIAAALVSEFCFSCSIHDICTQRVKKRQLIYSSLNVRSLLYKLDEVLEFVRDNGIDVMCLIESWHSVST